MNTVEFIQLRNAHRAIFFENLRTLFIKFVPRISHMNYVRALRGILTMKSSGECIMNKSRQETIFITA